MKRLHQITAGIFSIFLLMGPGLTLGAMSAESEGMSESQPNISLEEAIEIAKKAVPGKVVEAEYEREDEKDIYEVTIASSQGETRELTIDAATKNNASYMGGHRDDDWRLLLTAKMRARISLKRWSTTR